MGRIGGYEVVTELGRGAMGVVYEVKAPGTAERLALKLIADTRPEVVERFQREARLLLRLGRQPHIVGLRDFGEDRGRPFLVMDLIRGDTLEHRLRRGSIEPAKALALLADVADAVHAAHEVGIVHRDLKPSNILVDERGSAFLSDFGIAKDQRAEGLTATGSVLGTIDYMSPEQLDAADVPVERQTDVYALGVILYRVIAGALPFEGSGVSQMKRILTEPPRAPGEIRQGVDPRIEALCLRALAKDPARRPATAKELARELRAILEAPAPRSRPEGRGVTVQVLAGLVLLGLGVVIGRLAPGAAVPAPSPPPEPTREEKLSLAWSHLLEKLGSEKAPTAEEEAAVAALVDSSTQGAIAVSLPYAVARGCILRHDAAGAANALAALPAGPPRRLLQVEQAAADGDLVRAFDLIFETEDVRVSWRPDTPADRFVWLGEQLVVAGQRSRAATCFLRAAKELARGEDAAVQRAAALTDRAFDLDPEIALADAEPLAPVLRATAMQALEKDDPEPATVAIARLRLHRARFLRPDDPFPGSYAALRKLAKSPRRDVRFAACPWTSFEENIPDLSRALEKPVTDEENARAKIDALAETTPKRWRGPLEAVTRLVALSLGSAWGVLYEAVADWLVWRPDAAFLWESLGLVAVIEARFAESRLCAKICDRKLHRVSVHAHIGALDRVEKAAPLAEEENQTERELENLERLLDRGQREAARLAFGSLSEKARTGARFEAVQRRIRLP